MGQNGNNTVEAFLRGGSQAPGECGRVGRGGPLAPLRGGALHCLQPLGREVSGNRVQDIPASWTCF